MKTEIVNVTPTKAREWLGRNTDNRTLRPSTVLGIADAIRRGEWLLTHQGIAFSKSGRLLDGQHRLSAVVEANIGVPMLVTYDVSDDAFQGMDIGARRTAADVLGVPAEHAAVARFLAVVEDKTSRASLTPQYLIPFISAVAEPYQALVDFCPTRSKTWSSASVRSAAIVRMLDGADEAHVLMTYHSLVHLEFDSMPPIAQALVRQHNRGTVHAANMEMFLRCLKVFNPGDAALRTIQISSPATLLGYAREVIAQNIRGQKKAPAAKAIGAKKLVNVSRKSTATAH